MIFKSFIAQLSDNLLVDDLYLPLTTRDTARLIGILPEDEEMYLTISDGLYTEWVLARNLCGVIVLDRGVEGSEPHKFPKGSCIFFEASIPVIKWLICNYDCCADNECPCDPVTNDGMILPSAMSNVPWEGTAIFKGDTPMVMGVTGMPSWMHAEQGANHIRFYGTPTADGTYNIVASATNCSGTGIATQQGTVTVGEASTSDMVSMAVDRWLGTTAPTAISEASVQAFADTLQPDVTLGSANEESVAEATPAPVKAKARKSTKKA